MSGRRSEVCNYPQCQKCEYDYCIKDGVISQNLPPKKADRSEYYKIYYQNHKEQIKGKYQSKKAYLNYVKVRSEIKKLSNQIGSVNVDIVLKAIEQIEKENK